MSEENADPVDGASAETFNLVLFTNIADGEDPDIVKEKLAKALRVDASKVQEWYDSDSPTLLLKKVEKKVAERYMQAILACGATCNMQSTEEGGLSLVPKSRNMDFFICPSCEYEEEIPVDTKKEKCPKCGLVIAKWEEKMRAEKEKEQIRRRLLREARLKDDRSDDVKRKQAELVRLRKLEHEIMKELGLKPPGRFWLFFEQHPFSISSAFAMLILAMSAVVLFYVDAYLDGEEHKRLAAAPPGEEIERIAPVVTAAVQMQQNGNQAVVAELAQVTSVMRGADAASNEKILKSAEQMMKGVDPQDFVAAAANMAPLATRTVAGPQGESPVSVNIDTNGGVVGLRGQSRFTPEELQKIAPPLLAHGHEEVMVVLATRHLVPDPLNPDLTITVEEIDELDGSMIVDLMESLAKDLEWDLYIKRNLATFLALHDHDSAKALAAKIKNPAVRIVALGDIMEQMLFDDPEEPVKIEMASVRAELEEVSDPDARAKLALELGDRLSISGAKGEPGNSLDLVDKMIRDARNNIEKSNLVSRLAVAQVRSGDKVKARASFALAINLAGQLPNPVDRISAFTRIAQRYYDARNLTLASEILSEAQVLAATRLAPVERSRIFGEIAIAQGYMGDLAGAMISIRNAGVDEGEQQLIAKLAESLIGLDRFYEAQSIMAQLNDPIEFNRLKIRLVSNLIDEGSIAEATSLLDDAARRAREIEDPSERGLVLSQFGRLHARIGQEAKATMFFDEALALSDVLQGRKKAVNRGLVGLDQARALRIESSRLTMEQVTEAIVKDPIDSEIIETERILNLMPDAVKERVERVQY